MPHAFAIAALLGTLAHADPRVIDDANLGLLSGQPPTRVRILDAGTPRGTVEITRGDAAPVTFGNLLYAEDFWKEHSFRGLGLLHDAYTAVNHYEANAFLLEQGIKFLPAGQSDLQTHLNRYYRTTRVLLSGEQMVVTAVSEGFGPYDADHQRSADLEVNLASREGSEMRPAEFGGKRRYWAITAGCPQPELADYDRQGLPACARWEARHPVAKIGEQLGRAKAVRIRKLVPVGCDVHACGADLYEHEVLLKALRVTCREKLHDASGDFVLDLQKMVPQYDEGDYLKSLDVDYRARCVPGLNQE